MTCCREVLPAPAGPFTAEAWVQPHLCVPPQQPQHCFISALAGRLSLTPRGTLCLRTQGPSSRLLNLPEVLVGGKLEAWWHCPPQTWALGSQGLGGTGLPDRPRPLLPQRSPCNATRVPSPSACPAASPSPPATPMRPCARPHCTPWRQVSGRASPPGQSCLQPGPCVRRAAPACVISREGFRSKQPGSLPLSSPSFLEWEALAAWLGSHGAASPLEASRTSHRAPLAQGGRRKEGPGHGGAEAERVLREAAGLGLRGQPDTAPPCPQCTPSWGTPR